MTVVEEYEGRKVMGQSHGTYNRQFIVDYEHKVTATGYLSLDDGSLVFFADTVPIAKFLSWTGISHGEGQHSVGIFKRVVTEDKKRKNNNKGEQE